MAKRVIKWAWRVLLLAGVAAVVRRVLDPNARSGPTGDGSVPAIGGDTWPPVPTNPGDKV
jgi:hypothetical protein